MLCPHCGASLDEGVKFCENCGAPLNEPEAADTFYGYAPGELRLAPGYSRLVDSEAVQTALKKQRRSVRIAFFVIILLPLLGFTAYGALSDRMELRQALPIGLFVSAVFALAALISAIRHKLSRPFEATVADKKHRRYYYTNRSMRVRNRWRLILDCEDGRRRRKDVNRTVYDYLQPGDRVRFLPQFPQPFEKYDKSRDAEIPCMFCGRMNPVRNESCQFCRSPLVK